MAIAFPNTISISGFSILPELIPNHFNSECPKGTLDGKSSCFCEDHCSWNVCRLSKPSKYCGTSLRNPWSWDTSRNHWVAQGKYNT